MNIRKHLPLLLFIFILLLSLSPQAWAPPLIKIAVVDWPKVTMNFTWYQEQAAKIVNKRKTIDQLIAKENKEIQDMEKELASLADPYEILQKKAKIMKRKNDLDNFIIETNEILSSNEDILFNKTKERILGAIKKLAIKKGISLVFSKENLLYAAEDYTELTHDVISALNTEE